jgi:hypothetical protein
MLRSLSSFVALLLSLIAASGASAAQRTFVSTTGSDANTASNCANTTPCRGFTAALTVTDAGGEIIVLSSGGYGPVTINKSVSIIAPEGIYAGISVFSGDGITIATAGVAVVLRGLSINRLGGGGNGVSMTDGSSLIVQNCVISNFSEYGSKGLYVFVSGSARVRLLDSLLYGNYTGALFGGGPTVLVSGSRILDNTGAGIYAGAAGAGVTTQVEVIRSEASGSGDAGFTAYASTSGRVELNLRDSVASRNKFGVFATSYTGGTSLARVSSSLISGNTDEGFRASGSGAKMVVSGNKVTDNDTGLLQGSSAVFQSTGDNTVTDNGTATSGTITSLANM